MIEELLSKINTSFIDELPADPITFNSIRQVEKAAYSIVKPTIPKKAHQIHVSRALAKELDFSRAFLGSNTFNNLFSGTTILPDSKPYAMCYGGHQFGNWAGQLGDGRAINLFSIDHNKKKYTFQLKGAGLTPYSRTADGLAVLRSSIREHLCSEAMFHLGVPTTRSLSLMETGSKVLRDMLYNGNAEYEKGAVVCRVAPSFIRFGNFEIFASRGDKENLNKLLDYTITHHFKAIKTNGKEAYLAFFQEVANRTREMVIHWQRVGFVHGVMNTDNMSVHGLTIDYGPYGWLEDFDVNWTPNTTDSRNRRYRFGQQINITLWNLLQLANALQLVIDDAEALHLILLGYKEKAEQDYFAMMYQKLGLDTAKEDDRIIVDSLIEKLSLEETDYIIFFRELANFSATNLESRHAILEKALYESYSPESENAKQWETWFTAYAKRLGGNEIAAKERKAKMNQTNPKYVLRNYMAQLAIDKANDGDYALVDELYNLLEQPYAEQSEMEKWYAKRPEWARHKVGCSMLSCSS